MTSITTLAVALLRETVEPIRESGSCVGDCICCTVGRRMRRTRLVLVVAVLGVCALPVAGAGAVPAPQADRALDNALERLVEGEGGPPGAISMIHRDGRTAAHTAGVGVVRPARTWRPDDHMRVASVAKAFSGAVTLSLVESGDLELGDTIGELLRGQPSAWSRITLRQLLAHTSGLPDFSATDAFLEAFSQDLFRRFTPRELLAYVHSEPLLFAPGSSYHYSNTDNIAAALMAEAATGRSYDRLLRERVYRPLELRDTSLPLGARLPRPFAHGYALEPPGPLEDVSEAFGASGSWASGGIVSTPADLTRFVRGYVGGRLFGGRVQRAQRRTRPGNSDPRGPGVNRAGLALFRYRTRCGVVFGHTGNTAGYTQFIAASGDGRRSATVAINQQITAKSPRPGAFARLRRAFTAAACAALATRR
jgi:D-alanyl-D-alanine carboxypeptidase